MTKSIVTGMTVWVALVVGAGNADAHAHKAHMYKSHVYMSAQILPSLTAKGGPLHDCVHVTFPQCGDRGFHGPND
jgi:hypothetical protein